MMEVRQMLIDALSQVIFGQTGKLSPTIHDENLGKLLNMLREGKTAKEVREYIEKNAHLYLEHSTEMNKKELSMKVFLIVAKAIISDANKEIRVNTAIDALRAYDFSTDVAVRAVGEMIKAGLLNLRQSRGKQYVSLTPKACDIIREYNKKKGAKTRE